MSVSASGNGVCLKKIQTCRLMLGEHHFWQWKTSRNNPKTQLHDTTGKRLTMRSKQTGQVGSSTSDGVGGGAGLLVLGPDLVVVLLESAGEAAIEGVKGSCRISGNESSASG